MGPSLKQDIFEIAVPGPARNSSLISFIQSSSSTVGIPSLAAAAAVVSPVQAQFKPSLVQRVFVAPFCPNVIIPDATVNTSPPVFLLRLVRAPSSVA